MILVDFIKELIDFIKDFIIFKFLDFLCLIGFHGRGREEKSCYCSDCRREKHSWKSGKCARCGKIWDNDEALQEYLKRKITWPWTLKRLIGSCNNVNLCFNESNETFLHTASKYGHNMAVKHLLKCGAHIYGSSNGRTPLLIAAIEGHEKIVKTLLANGADPNDLGDMVGGVGGTALHYAIHKGSLPIVKLLIKYGANVNIFDQGGETPLTLSISNIDPYNMERFGHFPISKKYHDIATYLLKKTDLTDCLEIGPYDPYSPSSGRWTPLRLAASRGYIELVRLLVKAGADVNNRGEGDTLFGSPINLADFHRFGSHRVEEYKEIVEFLEANGGEI